MPSANPSSRRRFLGGAAAAGAALAAPSVLRAETAPLELLTLKSPPSGPSITLSHAVATDAFAGVARRVEFSLWRNPDELRAGLSSGRLPVAVAPAQGAASLYNRGLAVRLISVLTDGHCGLISRDAPLGSFAELRGLRVALPFFRDMTGHVMRRILKHHGVAEDALTLLPAATHNEGAQLLLSGRADAALLAEPVRSIAILKGAAAGVTLHRGVETRQEWARVTGLRPSLPQAALVALASFIDAHGDKIAPLHAALAAAAASANADPATAARHAAAVTERSAKALEAAIPYCALTAREGSTARPELEAMFSALAEADAGVIGGRLPDDGFYAL